MQIQPPALKYLVISDTQLPDVNETAIGLIKKFIPDFKPDVVFFGGDIVNFTTVGHYEYPADYRVTLNEELEMGRVFLEEITSISRIANPKVIFKYLEGNHEKRLIKYVHKKAREIFDITDSSGKQVLTLAHLLGLAKLNIEFIPFEKDQQIENALFFHGDRASKKSGVTAHSYVDDYACSVVVGHTHRLGLVFKTLLEKSVFGVETGCLCNREMEVQYVRHPNWMPGFAVLYHNIKTNVLHPTVVPIINNEFVFNGKIYE